MSQHTERSTPPDDSSGSRNRSESAHGRIEALPDRHLTESDLRALRASDRFQFAAELVWVFSEQTKRETGGEATPAVVLATETVCRVLLFCQDDAWRVVHAEEIPPDVPPEEHAMLVWYEGAEVAANLMHGWAGEDTGTPE